MARLRIATATDGAGDGPRLIERVRAESRRLGHDYVGTEHILLGILREESGVVAILLCRLGVDPARIPLEVDRLVARSSAVVPLGDLPYTPRAKRALELSLDEAHRLGHVGTDEEGRVTGGLRVEHMLLGLLREEEGVASRVLRALGVDLEATRREVRSLA